MNNFTESYLNKSNKLDGANYTNWKFRLQMLIEGSSAWLIVSGNEQKSTMAVGGTLALIQDCHKKENKGKVLLKMSIKYNIIPHMKDCKWSSDIWTTLKNLYQTQNTNRILSLKGKLFSMRMEENESVARFIAQVKDQKDNLGDIGEKVSNSDLITITLNEMMDEYQMFITSVSARKETPAFEELTGILIQEEEWGQNLRPQSVDLALMEKKNPYKAKPPQGQKGGGVFQKRPFRAIEEEESEIWFVDIGASSHMIGNRHWFENFEETTCGANIYPGDDRGYEIKGYGDILMMLPNGNIRYIKNVMYVPRIKKNLIFVSMMADQDLQVEFFISCYVIKENKKEPVASGVL
eukprot:PITA_29840